MRIYSELDLNTFEAWSGAVNTLDRIRREGKCEELESVLEENYPEEIAEALCNLAYDNPTTEVINGCKDGLLGLLALAQNPYNPEGYRVLYKVLETIVDVQEV